MAVMKVIEVLAESPDGFDAAAQAAVDAAAERLRNVRSVHVKEMTAHVENGAITAYRVNARITFELEAAARP